MGERWGRLKRWAGSVLLLLAVAGGVLVANWGCLTGNRDVLVVATADSIFELDPSLAISANSRRALYCVYETLVRPGVRPGEVIPWLAQSWRREKDGKIWRFTLREGVCFHDGTPLTADLVADFIRRSWGLASVGKRRAYTFQRTLLGEQGRPLLEKVEVLSPRELRLTLRKPLADFLEILSHPAFALTWVSSWREDGTPVLQGTGPFSVEDFRPGQRLTLRRFENYWHHYPTWSRIIFRTIRNSSQRALELERDHVDLAWAFSGAPLQELRDNSSCRLIKHRGQVYWRLALNCAQPPFSNCRCRFGVQSGIAADSLLRSVFGPEAERASCCLPRACWALPSDFAVRSYDVAKARSWYSKRIVHKHQEGLAQVELLYNAQANIDERVARLALGIVGNLQQMGVNACGLGVTEREFQSRLATGYYTIALLQTEQGDCDPDISLSMQWSDGDEMDGFVNIENYSSDRMSQALIEARTTEELQARRRTYKRALGVLREDAPEVPLAWVPIYSACSSQLRNIKIDRFNMFDLSEASF